MNIQSTFTVFSLSHSPLDFFTFLKFHVIIFVPIVPITKIKFEIHYKIIFQIFIFFVNIIIVVHNIEKYNRKLT